MQDSRDYKEVTPEFWPFRQWNFLMLQMGMWLAYCSRASSASSEKMLP